ncbi:MAG: hypothetical protein ABJF01_05970 [bacterium]
MSVSAPFQPENLDFTSASIGLIQISRAPIDAQLLARIEGGPAYFKLDSVIVYDVVNQIVDPGELPPGHKGPPPKQKIYTEVGRSNGTTPLAVTAGQFIEVRVTTLPLNGTATLDTILGMAVIKGDAWDPINVPLSRFVGQVATTFDATPLYATIAQGDSADVPFTVTSVRGFDTDATYDMGPTLGLTLASPSIHLPARSTAHGTMRIHADATAPLGDRAVEIYESAFDGKQRDVISGPNGFTVHVSRAPASRTPRIAILRYQWQTPDAKANTLLPKWDDWVFQDLFSNANGWSLRDFWKRCTFGLVVPQFILQPWRTLPLTESGQQNDRQLMINLLKAQAQTDGVSSTSYDQVVAFIHPPPCGAGASGAGIGPKDALFDQAGGVYFYQHEIGHVLGFQHAWGPANPTTYASYYDDYCVMGFSKTQSRVLQAPSNYAGVRVTPDFWTSERRLSAAALYRYVPEFATPTTVRRVVAGGRTTIALTGLGWASLDDLVLAVVSTSRGEITVEYRPAVGDDGGVTPAFVIHSIGRRSVTAGASEVQPVFYEGKIAANASGQFRTLEGDVSITYDVASKNGRMASITIQA